MCALRAEQPAQHQPPDKEPSRVKRVTKAPRPLGLLRREHSRRVVESELRIVEPRSPEMDIGSQYLHNPSRPAC
jgi:hypothetical protein